MDPTHACFSPNTRKLILNKGLLSFWIANSMFYLCAVIGKNSIMVP